MLISRLMNQPACLQLLTDIHTLQRMAFVVEIALANARKDDSEIQIKNKQDLLFVLTDRNIFVKVLKQADNTKYRIP